MTRSLDIRAEAERDLEVHAERIREDSPRSALRFLQETRATMERLLAMPELGGLYESAKPELAGLRSFTVSRFRKYVIFYRPTESGIEVLRVLHGSRDIDRILGLDPEPGEQDGSDGESAP